MYMYIDIAVYEIKHLGNLLNVSTVYACFILSHRRVEIIVESYTAKNRTAKFKDGEQVTFCEYDNS